MPAQYAMNKASNLTNGMILQTVIAFNEDSQTIDIKDIILPNALAASTDLPCVTPEDVTQHMDTLDPRRPLIVTINSKGGEIGAALEMYDAVRKHPSEVTTIVTGYAYSAAGKLAMAGDKRIINTGGMFMMHNPRLVGITVSSTEDIDQARTEWEAHRTAILNIFEDRTDIPREKLDEYLTPGGTYMAAQEAVDAGFFHEVGSSKANLTALNYLDTSSLPEDLKATIPEYTENTEDLVNSAERRLAALNLKKLS